MSLLVPWKRVFLKQLAPAHLCFEGTLERIDFSSTVTGCGFSCKNTIGRCDTLKLIHLKDIKECQTSFNLLWYKQNYPLAILWLKIKSWREQVDTNEMERKKTMKFYKKHREGEARGSE